MIVAIANNAEFGPTSVIGVFVLLEFFYAFSPHKVAADMAGFQTGRVNSCQGNA